MRLLPRQRDAVLAEEQSYREAWRRIQKLADDPAAEKPHNLFADSKQGEANTVASAVYLGEHVRAYRAQAIEQNRRQLLTPSYVNYSTLLNPNINTPHPVTRWTACLFVGNGALLDRIGPTTTSVNYLEDTTQYASYVKRLIDRAPSRMGNLTTGRTAVFAAGHLVQLDDGIAVALTEYDDALTVLFRETLGPPYDSKSSVNPAGLSTSDYQYLSATTRLLSSVLRVRPSAFQKLSGAFGQFLRQCDSAYAGGAGHSTIDPILTQRGINDLLQTKNTSLSPHLTPI